MTWVLWKLANYDGFHKNVTYWAKQPYTSRLRFISVLFVLSFGASLFIIKHIAQFYYGLLETVFAIAVCTAAVDSIHATYAVGLQPQGAWFGLASFLYLLVRGLSNIYDGWKKGDTNLKRFITGKID